MNLLKRLIAFLTDKSAARDNMREVTEILREVTQVSRGDGDFDKILCQVLDKHEPGSSFYRAPRFRGFIWESYRTVKHGYPSSLEPLSYFIMAERVLENLPHIYGLPGEER